MTNNNIFSSDNSLNNAAQNTNTIKINMNDGKVNGNTIDETIIAGSVECVSEILWFYCEDNSQYLFLLC